MRPVVIVVVAPCRNRMAGVVQRREQVFVQAFLAHPSIETFHQAVLHGFAGSNVMPADLSLLLPFQRRVRSQLRAIVRDHHTGVAA